MRPEGIVAKYNLDRAQNKIVQHQDVIQRDSLIGSVKKADTGFLVGLAPVAKVGVMTYLMADGTVVREFVPPETLFEEKSRETLKLKPVTEEHPPEKKVNSDNARYRQIGSTGENVKEEGVYLLTSLVITDSDSIEDILEGKQELSPGYQTELVFQKGSYDGVDDDVISRFVWVVVVSVLFPL